MHTRIYSGGVTEVWDLDQVAQKALLGPRRLDRFQASFGQVQFNVNIAVPPGPLCSKLGTPKVLQLPPKSKPHFVNEASFSQWLQDLDRHEPQPERDGGKQEIRVSKRGADVWGLRGDFSVFDVNFGKKELQQFMIGV